MRKFKEKPDQQKIQNKNLMTYLDSRIKLIQRGIGSLYNPEDEISSNFVHGLIKEVHNLKSIFWDLLREEDSAKEILKRLLEEGKIKNA